MAMKKSKKEEENTNFRVYLGADKEWLITSDQFQFILYRKVKAKKEGSEPRYTIEGFYPNLGHLLEMLAMKKLRGSEIKTLKGIEKQLKLLRDEVEVYKKVILK